MSTLKRLFHSLTAQMERVAELPSADGVHDLRVAIRRLSEALRIYEVPGSKKLRKRIRRIRRQAGELRDRDVALRLLLHHKIPASDPTLNFLKGQRALAAEQLQRYLKRQLRKPFDIPAAPPSATAVPSFDDLFNATEIHPVRIAAKRLRYALEILEPDNLRAHGLLRKMQKELGDIHDGAVTASRLLKIPGVSRPVRAVANRLRSESFKKERRFFETWPERARSLLKQP